MTTLDVALRPMQLEDLDAVRRLETALFTDDPWSAAMFREELGAHDTRHYLVATAADEVVGYAGLCAYADDQAFVQTIAVDPAHQRHGIGTALLSALVEEADRRGCAHLDLEVRADNPPAIALYERFGFRRIGVRPRYYQPSGTDAIVMRREQP
ncbi:MAG TPA: ribosomal protein S18-alanine N-acetyltransferase [Mycobacteriales bacterium]|nr:ribosomal protein S18-alanine N-acetyltransferase [Mycobacteriales bacterium]